MQHRINYTQKRPRKGKGNGIDIGKGIDKDVKEKVIKPLMAEYRPDQTQDAHDPMPVSSTASPQATGCLMQCVDCKRRLCDTEDLAFFKRINQQGGVEVHLMFKPENTMPETFIRSPVTEKGAMASWQCACGRKFGNTRTVGVKWAPMTAFKSSSVMLCGHRFTGRESEWPSRYNQSPFNAIKVRTRDTFLGLTLASRWLATGL